MKSKKTFLFSILLIAILTLNACSLSIVVPAPLPPENPTEFVMITIVIVPTDSSAEMAVFAKHSTASPTVTFEGGKPPTLEDVKLMSDANPFSGIEFQVISPDEKIEKGVTDAFGHLNMVIPFTNGTSYIAGNWYCENIVPGYSTDGSKVLETIEIILCSR